MTSGVCPFLLGLQDCRSTTDQQEGSLVNVQVGGCLVNVNAGVCAVVGVLAQGGCAPIPISTGR